MNLTIDSKISNVCSTNPKIFWATPSKEKIIFAENNYIIKLIDSKTNEELQSLYHDYEDIRLYPHSSQELKDSFALVLDREQGVHKLNYKNFDEFEQSWKIKIDLVSVHKLDNKGKFWLGFSKNGKVSLLDTSNANLIVSSIETPGLGSQVCNSMKIKQKLTSNEQNKFTFLLFMENAFLAMLEIEIPNFESNLNLTNNLIGILKVDLGKISPEEMDYHLSFATNDENNCYFKSLKNKLFMFKTEKIIEKMTTMGKDKIFTFKDPGDAVVLFIPESDNDEISRISQLSENSLLILTKTKSVYLFNKFTLKFTKYLLTETEKEIVDCLSGPENTKTFLSLIHI